MAVRPDRALGRRVIVGSAPKELLGARDPFEALEGLPRARGDADVGGGWFGWLGYGLESRAGELPPGPPRVVPLPDAHLGFYDNVLRLDGAGRWWFESLGEPGARLDDVRARLAAAPASVPPAPATFAPRAAAHIAAVRGCVARIAVGEMSRVHLCLRLGAQWEDDVVALFARAAARLRPAYGACFVAPWGGVASCSPEPFPRPSAPAAGIRGDARLRTAFPAASVTGAPKARAMTAIAELETTGREATRG